MENIDEIGSELIEKMPDPDVDETIPESQNPPSEEGGFVPEDLLTDVTGQKFDATKHMLSKDGTPALTKTGKFRKLRKPKRTSQIGALSEGESDAGYKTAGYATAQTVFILGQMIGEEWKPTPPEQGSMVEAWTSYYKVKGITDLPPSMIVIAAMISYIGPRVTADSTRKKFSRVKKWFSRFRRSDQAVRENNGT